MPYFLIDGLFTRGLFSTYDSVETAKALLQYGWGVPAFVLTRILAPAFFARQDTKGPMIFALASVTVNVVLGIALFRLVGVQGIAAATSAAARSGVPSRSHRWRARAAGDRQLRNRPQERVL